MLSTNAAGTPADEVPGVRVGWTVADVAVASGHFVTNSDERFVTLP